MKDSMPMRSERAARAHVVWQLRDQARSCLAMGSPLYGALLDLAAADVARGGPAWRILRHHVAPGRGGALALRFMAAVHRLVLTGEAPALAACYPSTGGNAVVERAWPAFARLLEDRYDTLVDLVALPCQTNEVGRCAGLLGGFLAVVTRTGLPLRILEVGASAGLNLRWDRFRYGGGGSSWGDPDSPVDLTGLWTIPPAATDVKVEVVARAGCDLQPVDPGTPAGRLALTASVWADQRDRFSRLQGALRVAERVPAVVHQASLEQWLPPRLAEAGDGVATVVYHSVVDEYLSAAVRRRFRDILTAAGERATGRAPLAWLRLEPVTSLRRHGITLTSWPTAQERLLGTCGAHGADLRWLDAAP